ncbi:hypothetical protein FYJ45_25035 [Eisenbergiella tayi]|uniref:Uncharacterized protein n=1 Tax=Eisenbergiella porci TaxID=2652274 RepID=A0A6N7WPQ4_9FIRM|nr:hypothetical protein [Eisenbergiella porci]MSS91380.1 hypothetical protein [Eisenbergiella porci]
MMDLSVFCDKLNKVDGKVYVIEEEIQIPDSGIYEAELQHDNIVDSTLAVYTGPTLTGEQLQTYALSTPSLMPWKRIIRIQTDKKVVYVSYETDGDTVEAQDINIVQDAILETQGGVNAEEARAKSTEMELNRNLQAETERATGEEQRLDGRIDTEASRAQEAENILSLRLDAETGRAEAVEQKNADAIAAEAERAAGAEKKLADNLTGEISRAKAAEEVNADNITAESSRATAAENKNAEDIKAETTRAESAEASIRSTINTNKPIWDDKYTRNEVDNKFSTLETAIDWKEAVNSFADLATAYPKPDDGWTVNVKDTDYTYRWSGTEWVAISANAIPKATQSVDGLLSKEDKAYYDDAYSKRHTHSNKGIIDKITQSLLDAWNAAYTHISDTVMHVTEVERNNWDDANNKKHTHSNKGVIDKLTQAMLDKLSGIAAGAEVNVQPDWNTTDAASDAYIKNKPSALPASDVKAWAKAETKPAYGWTEITGKPSSYTPSAHNHTKSQITDMPTKLSQFTNDSGYITSSDVDTSQNHTHSNKVVLDEITQPMLDKWNTDSDTKVTQTNTTGSADYRMMLSGNANDSTETNIVRKSTHFLANPATGEFYAKGFRRINITGQTLDINTLNLSSGTPCIMRCIEKTSGGAANITNIPVTGQPFLLDIELIRWASATDYITMQTFRNAANPANEYVRFCTSGTWGGWVTRVFTDTKYSHPNSGVTAGTYKSVTVNAQGHVTGGSNPTTLAGYGITDAAAKSHNHDTVYLKKGAMKWNDLGGG